MEWAFGSLDFHSGPMRLVITQASVAGAILQLYI